MASATGLSRTLTLTGTVDLPSSLTPGANFRQVLYEVDGSTGLAGLRNYWFDYTASRGSAFVEFAGIRLNFGSSGPFADYTPTFQNSYSIFTGIEGPDYFASWGAYKFINWKDTGHSDVEYVATGGTGSGSFSITVTVKQYVSIRRDMPYSVDNSDGEPEYWISFFEMVDISTPASVSLSIGGLSGTFSIDLSTSAGNDFPADQAVLLGANAQIWSDKAPFSATATITATMPDGNGAVIPTSDYFDGFNYTYGYSAGASATCTGQTALSEPVRVGTGPFGLAIYTSLQDIKGTCNGGVDLGNYMLYGPYAYYTDIQCSNVLLRKPDLAYSLESNIKAFGVDFPETVQWLNEGLNPQTYQEVNAGGVLSTAQATPQTCYLAFHKGLSANTYAPTFAYISSTTSGDYRLMAHGWYLPGIKIGHDDWISIPNTTPDATWAGEGGTTATPGSGPTASECTIVAPFAAVGVATLTQSSWLSIEGYRYWKLQVFGDGEVLYTLGDKTWAFEGVAGVWTDITLDLCSPDAGGEKIQQDSRYPLVDGYPNDLGQHFGVAGFSVLTVQIPPGKTIILRQQICQTLQDSYLCICARFQGFVAITGSTPVWKRHTVAETDGRQSLEVLDVAGATFYTLAEWCDQVNGFGGWAANVDPALSSIYANSSSPAFWIGGGGIVWNSGWEDYTAVALNGSMGTLGIPLSVRYDILSAHPGCGDPFSGSGYGSYAPVPFRVSKQEGYQAHGIVFDSAGDPVSGATVQVVGHGSGVSRSDGYFITTTPYEEGNVTREVVTDYGKSSITFTNRDRKRSTAIFNSGGAGKMLGDPYGRLHKISLDTNGYVVYFRSDKGAPVSGWPFTSTVSLQGGCTSPAIAQGVFSQLFVVYELSGKVYSQRSTDAGQTWTTPFEEFGSGSRPMIASNQFGTLLIVERNGAGKVAISRYLTSSTTPETYVAKNESGTEFTIEDLGIGVAAGVEQFHPWHMSVTLTGDTSESHFVSTDDGRTWKLIS